MQITNTKEEEEEENEEINSSQPTIECICCLARLDCRNDPEHSQVSLILTYTHTSHTILDLQISCHFQAYEQTFKIYLFTRQSNNI